jgi:hypothetical protein
VGDRFAQGTSRSSNFISWVRSRARESPPTGEYCGKERGRSLYAEKRRLMSAWLPAGETRLSHVCVRLAFVICTCQGKRRKPDRRGGVSEDIERIFKHTAISLTHAHTHTR